MNTPPSDLGPDSPAESTLASPEPGALSSEPSKIEYIPIEPTLARLARTHPTLVKDWDGDNPYSVVNLLPEDFLSLLEELPPDARAMDFSQLESISGLTRLDRRVRLEFWSEHERAARANRKMHLDAVVKGAGLMTWSQYLPRLEMNDYRLAWLMSPPAHYSVQLREALDLGITRLLEILALPIQAGGKVDSKAAQLVLAAYKLVDARLHGSFVQKSVNINKTEVSQNITTISADSKQNSQHLLGIDEKIAELEQKLKEQEDRAAGVLPDLRDRLVDLPELPLGD